MQLKNQTKAVVLEHRFLLLQLCIFSGDMFGAGIMGMTTVTQHSTHRMNAKACCLLIRLLRKGEEQALV